MNTSRTGKSIKNILFSLFGFVCTTLLQLVNRLMFVHFLPIEYLGIHGLFTNLISMLALSELGIGSAMIYALYKPVATKDKERIKSLMALYKKLYWIIGCIIFILGLSLLPFLPRFMKEQPDIPYISFYFLLYVFNAGVSYFYTFKRSIIICNQEEYIPTLVTMITSILTRLIQIFVLYFTQSFFQYLLVQIVFTLVENWIVSYIADKKYPYLKEKEVQPLKKKEIQNIQKNVYAMVFHKIGDVVVNATDNILVSRLLGLSFVGYLYNYTMIFDLVSNVVLRIFSSLTPSLGNLIAIESREKSEEVFYRLLFGNFWLVSFCCVCLYCLCQPFLSLWLGDSFILDQSIVFVLCAVFYVMGMRRTALQYRSAAGLFYQDRYKPLIESVVNLALSIPLTMHLGIVGVKLGTILSLLTTAFWMEGYILYKYYFQKSCLSYLYTQAKFGLITLICMISIHALCSLVSLSGIPGFLLQGMLCVVGINGIYLLFFYKKEEFQYYKKLIFK
ncbi:MAG: hypothetical protein KBT48_00250, partial [Firmicutes bacterium]|nr:hypothetical protein [Bacillota bacterium]